MAVARGLNRAESGSYGIRTRSVKEQFPHPDRPPDPGEAALGRLRGARPAGPPFRRPDLAPNSL